MMKDLIENGPDEVSRHEEGRLLLSYRLRSDDEAVSALLRVSVFRLRGVFD